jgi:ribosomal protein S18 acetylase RimI-like enzyme
LLSYFLSSGIKYKAAKEFIKERLERQDSVILLATKDNKPVGYTQLFPSFSSVSMKRVWILNDLFVIPEMRNQGIAKALMNAAKDYAIATKAVRIVLATEVTNIVAQKLYETMGYRKFDEFYHYILAID